VLFATLADKTGGNSVSNKSGKLIHIIREWGSPGRRSLENNFRSPRTGEKEVMWCIYILRNLTASYGKTLELNRR